MQKLAVILAFILLLSLPAQAQTYDENEACVIWSCLYGHDRFDREGKHTEYGIAWERLPDGPDGRYFIEVLYPMVSDSYRWDPARYEAWMPLAHCESGNNPSINTGNGYHGLVQFHPQTWRAYGGEQFAAYAYQAAAVEQLTVAERVLWAGYGNHGPQGRGAWPGCLRKGMGAPLPP